MSRPWRRTHYPASWPSGAGRPDAALGLSPTGIVLVLLVVVSLSIAVLVLGMMSSLRLARQERA
ncbi:hypothetical protein [Tautonia marina]|uniref:hypothetical protein n=1 Tax=Tautonia marina TaxID=2653855 RepID=UPI0012612DEA|nr:hypothetical protein [Tautonia marina]